VAGHAPTPLDRIYVHNFEDPRRPRLITLAAGTATEIAAGIQELTEACRRALPAAFESESYESRVKQSLDAISKERDQALASLERTAKLLGFTVTSTPMGMMAAPLGADGRPMSAEMLAGLPEDVRRPIEARGEQVQDAVMSALRTLRKLETRARDAVLEVDREVTRFVIGPIIDELEGAHGQNGLAGHFAAIEQDIIANMETFKRFAAMPAGGVPEEVVRHLTLEREGLLRRYGVNAFVTHKKEDGAPIVEERQPSYMRLMGRVEFENQMGVMVTDFMHVQPGSIHQANGGYLVLQAEDLLTDARAWLKLKLALRTREVRTDDVSEMLAIPVAGLWPEAVPLDVKVILIGQPYLLAMLDAVDPDFHELFKVRAEFAPDMHVNDESVENYAGFVEEVAARRSLRPFEAEATRELLRYGSRLAGRQDRLTARLGLVEDLCAEANAIAAGEKSPSVKAAHVLGAIDAAERRSGLIADRIREMIAERRLYVATEGVVQGQVNGLAVIAAGDHAFGMPMRITCRAGAGRRGIVDIERETERSGAIHTKGVLVLEGFLMGTFGRTAPLSFNASLTFEQSYEEVEGDSASAAELCAILTALAEAPVRQDVAITGSVDQFGNVQAAGITQKVEGFFEACREAGFTAPIGGYPCLESRDLCLKPSWRRWFDGPVPRVDRHRVEEALEPATASRQGSRQRGYPRDDLLRVARVAAAQDGRGAEGGDEPGGE
jgi:predicted ATP-dependent protease